MYKLEELNNSKVSELREIAKKLEIKNHDKLKKLDLAYAILDYQAEHNNAEKNKGEAPKKIQEKTNPKKSFEAALAFAKEVNADIITLVGDIFSFPSELAIEWVLSKLEAISIPYIYIAGNHDWHYEGMKGELKSLRDEWIEKRLMPLYQGKNPLMAAYDIKGIKFLAIDNSTYEINEEQLVFFSKQLNYTCLCSATKTF